MLHFVLFLFFRNVRTIIIPPGLFINAPVFYEHYHSSDEFCNANFNERNIESCFGRRDNDILAPDGSFLWIFHCCSTLSAEQLSTIPGALPQIGKFKLICPDGYAGHMYEGPEKTMWGGQKDTKIVCEETVLNELVKSFKTWVNSKTFGKEAVAPLLGESDSDEKEGGSTLSASKVTCHDVSSIL